MATTTALPQTVSLTASDWATIALYVGATAGIAAWSRWREYRRRGEATGSEDYFLAGRRQNWAVVAVTLFAATFSTISFVALPGEAFGHGLTYSLGLYITPIVTPLAVWLFLRFFFLSPSYTSYEYLERRFSPAMRVAGAGLFTLSQLIYGGVVFYAASQLFDALVGWTPWKTVVFVGGFTVLYTTVGGMKAVIATNFMQALVRVLGIAIVLFALCRAIDFDLAGMWRFAHANDHAYNALGRASFYKPDLHTRYNAWVMLYIIVTGALMSVSSNQLMVQRLLTTTGYRSARRSAIMNTLQAIPLVGIFYVVGLALFFYYRGLHPERLPAGLKNDHVIGHFIATELPAPVPGLILVAVLSAMMSPISSVVNAVATVVYRDGIARVGWAEAGGPRELTTCRLLSVAAGAISVGVALGLLALDALNPGQSNPVIEINGIWGSLGGVLLAAFLIGVLAPRVSAGPMLVGSAVGATLTLALPWRLYYSVDPAQRISFAWLGVPGFAATLVLPVLLSLVWPQRKDVTGLTLWTIRRDRRADVADDAPAVPAVAPASAG